MHWPVHKVLCKTWKAVRQIDTRGMSLDALLPIMVEAFEKANSRPPTSSELRELLQMPRCNACGKAAPTIRCETSFMVGYCSEECRDSVFDEHEKVVTRIQHTATAARLLQERGQGPGAVSTEKAPLGSWEAYLKEAKVLLFDRPLSQADELHQAIVKDGLSCPLTVLEALRLAKRMNCLGKEAVIDVIGAAGYEFDAFMKWEEILQQCPKLESLTVRMIGPEALVLDDDTTLPCSTDLSTRLRREGRQMTLEFAPRPCRYEEWLSDDNRAPANVRVAFNCGFAEHAGNAEQHTWPAALEAIAAKGDKVPLIFSSLTPLDAARDLEVAMRTGLTPLVRPTENPFASPLEIPDAWERPAGAKVQPTFAFNAYIAVLEGK
jgi:hypothetical protein